MRTVKSGQLLWGKSGKQTYIQNLSIREFASRWEVYCWLSLWCEGWSSAPIDSSDCPRCSQSLCSANSPCWLAGKGHGAEQDPSSYYCVSVGMCATARGRMSENSFVERVLVSTLMCGKLEQQALYVLGISLSLYFNFYIPVRKRLFAC